MAKQKQQQQSEQAQKQQGGSDAQSEKGLQLAALKVIARMDLEAAAAYETAAQASEIADIRDQLMQFRDDHLRHVEDLAPFVKKMGAEPLSRHSDASSSLFRELAQMAEPLGATGALLMMLGNEDVTNGAYQAIMMFDWDADLFEVLQNNQADEQRHLNWLSEREDQLSEAAGEQPPPPA